SLAASSQWRSSINQTAGSRRLRACTTRLTTAKSRRCRASGSMRGAGRSGSGTPWRSNTNGRLSRNPSSRRSSFPAIFSRAACGMEPGTERAGALELEDAHRPACPFDRERAQVAQPKVALDEPGRVLRQVDAIGGRELLHALREPHRVADRGVVHAEIVADAA